MPPIYPLAPGMFDRALPIEGLNLQAITPFAIELHDIIITKEEMQAEARRRGLIPDLSREGQ